VVESKESKEGGIRNIGKVGNNIIDHFDDIWNYGIFFIPPLLGRSRENSN